MASVKADNERELTSTMGNVLSMSSKDEKNDTSDATPTSSTDANTTSTASQIVSDDPISSTSSDIVEQNKSKSAEAAMQSYVEASQAIVDEPDKSSSADPEADLLEMSISNVTNEKITEDVEDLVHDLESLLGESTDSFNVTIKRKEDKKSAEEKETSDQQQTSSIEEKEQDVLVSDDPVSSKAEEKSEDADPKEDMIAVHKNDASQETKDQTDKPELDDGTIEKNADENNDENNKQTEEHGPSLDKNSEQVDLVSDISIEPQSSSESKNIEEVIEEKPKISPRDDEKRVEEITENTVVDSDPSIKVSEVSTEATGQSDVLTEESKNDVEEAKGNKKVTELSDIKENRIEEEICDVEKAELNTDTTETITVPKDIGDGESAKDNEQLEENVEKREELVDVVKSNTKELEIVVHSREETAEIIVEDKVNDEPKDTEMVECLEGVKVYVTSEVIEGGPSGDHQLELKIAKKKTSAPVQEGIEGDSKTENMKKTESCPEESIDKQQKQVIDENSSENVSGINITETKEIGNPEEKAKPSTEENGSLDNLKEENMSSKSPSDAITSGKVEETETEKQLVQASPDISNALQFEVAECEQVDGTNTESDENKPQSESTSNTDTEHKTDVNNPETVSESNIEGSVESAAQDCSTNVKETEAPEDENLEEAMDVNESESQRNIPESTVDVVLEKRESKANVDTSDTSVETTADTSKSEASPISDRPADDEVPSSQPVEQVGTSGPGEEPAVTDTQSALTTSKSEASPVSDKPTDDEVPSSQPMEQVTTSDPDEESAETATQSALTTSKSDSAAISDKPTDEVPSSHPVEQVTTSDPEEELAETATQSALTTSKSEASPMPDKPNDDEVPSSQPVEQIVTSDPEAESAVADTQSAVTTSKSEASPMADKLIDDEVPSSRPVEQMATSDPEEESTVTPMKLETPKSVETTTTPEVYDDVVVINDDEIVGTISKLEDIEEKIAEDPSAELEHHEVIEEVSEKFDSELTLTNDGNNEAIVTTAAEPSDMEENATVTAAETEIIDNSSKVIEIDVHSGHVDIASQETVQPETISDKTDAVGATEEKVQAEDADEKQEKPAEPCGGTPVSDNVEDVEPIQTTSDAVGPSEKSDAAEVQLEDRTESEEAECKLPASQGENIDSTETDETPTSSNETAPIGDESSISVDTPKQIDENPNPEDEIAMPVDETIYVNDEILTAVIETPNAGEILQPSDETANINDNTSKSIVETQNLDDANSNSVDETQNPDNGISMEVDETAGASETTPKGIEGTPNLGDGISNSTDETLSIGDGIPKPADETVDNSDDTSKPIEETANMDQTIPNSVDETPIPDVEIPKSVDETADVNYDTCKPIENTSNLNQGISNSSHETSNPDNGIPRPHNETADGNDDTSKPIEETPILNDEISSSVDETPKPVEGDPITVEAAGANDDTSKPIEEPSNLDDGIPNAVDEVPNPDDEISKPVDETADATDDTTSKPIEGAPNSDDGIPNSLYRAPNPDDGIAKTVDETADTSDDISEPIEKTSSLGDGIPISVDETLDLGDKFPMSVDETPNADNESCKLVNAVVESSDQSSNLPDAETYLAEFVTPTEEPCEPTKLETSELSEESSHLDKIATEADSGTPRLKIDAADMEMGNIPVTEHDDVPPSVQSSDIVTLPDSSNEVVEATEHLLKSIQEQPNYDAQIEKEDTRIIEISDDDSKAVDSGDIIQIISSGADSDSEELVPVLALEPDENNPPPKEPLGGKDDSETEKSSVEVHSVGVAAEAEPMPEIEDILADQGQVDEAVASIDMQENLETILAVASLQNADSTEDEVTVEPQMSEKERREMEALRKAVESITDNTAVEYEEDVDNVVGELIKDVDIPVGSVVMETETVDEPQDLPHEEPDSEDNRLNVIIDKVDEEVDKVEDIDNGEDKSEKVVEPAEFTGEITDQDVPELRLEDSAEEVEEHTVEENTIEAKAENAEIDENPQSLPDTSEDKICKIKTDQVETTGVLPDSSQIISPSEEAKQSEAHKETKARASERPKRHRKAPGDIKLEELSINTDVPDKDKPYSPKVTIKPIRVPDDEVSTTSNSDTEVGKGSLKMTITKQSDKMHSILKICDPESSEAGQEQDEPIPKLIIKPKMQQVEQQHSPKMSTRSSKQVYSPTSTSQRSGSPRITIKPVVKPEKVDTVSPLKIKLKPEEMSKKHSPKLNIKPVTKPEEDTARENVQLARKVIIKPVVKPVEEVEQVHSPRITIKPIPKPEADKESTSNTPRLNIKPIKKQEDEDIEQEREKSAQKITIKPVVKPPEPDTQSPTDEEEVKERIVLKINKGNLPTPTKDPKKREHPPDDDKSEKLAKITVKFSKGGGHPHIVQQPEESNKRAHEDQASPEKVKKQKTEVESPIATRSKHKETVVESSVETRSKHKETTTDNPGSEQAKAKQKESESPVREPSKTKHKDPISESPIEPKKLKLKEIPSEMPVYESTRSRHKEPPSESPVSEATRSKQKEHNVAEKPTPVADNPGNVKVTVVETKVESPIVISEDSRSQDSGSCVIVEDPKDPLAAIPVFEIRAEPAKAMTPKQETVTPVPATPPTPMPRKRGRPRKVPIVVREEFKEQEEPKPEPPKSEEPQPVQDSGRPKRSCRGQSVRATLGIKPRKPRGPGRGRGSKRGMGTRSVPMKPEGEPKLSKAKLKLIQKTLQEELAKAAKIEKEKKQLAEALVTDVDIKAPAPVLAPPEIPTGEVPASPSTGLPVPSPQAPVASPASLPVASPKPSISLTPTETSTADSVTPSTSTRVSGEIVMVDEETRMSADTNSRAQTPAKQVVPADAVIEESQSSVQSTATTESGKAASSRPNKAPRLEVQEPEGAVISADQLTEYYWNGNGPFMLQEQVAQFLGIKSFKRKYPGIMRRMLDMQERDFIRESGLASEHMCDLGLTAVNSADILDIMYSDFQEKYEEYCKHQRDRQAKDLINKQKALSLAASQEKNKADITEQAVQSAAQWNASFNKARREQRKACMDLQTLTVHYPKGKMKQINKPKVGNYPVALVPGQYTDYYKEFTPTEINNLPINTMCYEPINIIPPEESDDSGSEGSDSDSDSSSSSSGSGSDSSSGVEDCKLCKHSPKKVATSK